MDKRLVLNYHFSYSLYFISKERRMKIKKVYLGRKQIYPETRIPWSYQEVEYIESTKTQRISTWFNVKSTMKVQTDFMITQSPWWSNDSEVLFWTNYGSWNWTSALVFYHTGNWLQTALWNSAIFSPFSLATKHSFEWSQTSATLDWVTKSISAWTSSYEVTLFYWNNIWWYTRIYTFKIYDWTILVRDLVPCYRREDGVIGMYDLVEWVFYTNSWSGIFTKWPDVN